MSADGTTSPFYAVTYSDRVLAVLARLGRTARDRGDGEQFVASLREFHRRLCVYPQFGDPLSDLKAHPGHVRLGVVPPLAMRYGVLEDQRLVVVAAPPVLMYRSNRGVG